MWRIVPFMKWEINMKKTKTLFIYNPRAGKSQIRGNLSDVLDILVKSSKNVSPDVVAVLERFRAQFEHVRDLTTPSEKPIYEMTLEEFEKVMNI